MKFIAEGSRHQDKEEMDKYLWLISI